MPIFINVVTNVAMRKINKSEKVSHELKNELIIYGVCVTACVVAIIHRDYVAISGAYVFPIVLSALYNRKRLLNRTFYIAIVSLTVTIAIQVMEKSVDLDYMLNTMVSYGFAIVFNKKSANQCEGIMNKILEEFKKIKYEFSDECVTFSCGVAQYNNMETRESFFNRADKYMYDAKRNGKNRVVALAM